MYYFELELNKMILGSSNYIAENRVYFLGHFTTLKSSDGRCRNHTNIDQRVLAIHFC